LLHELGKSLDHKMIRFRYLAIPMVLTCLDQTHPQIAVLVRTKLQQGWYFTLRLHQS